jgi:transketolase
VVPLSAQAVDLTARTIRVLTVDAVDRAGIGHVGLPLGCAEIGTVLFAEFLRHDPAAPDWPDRDRFVLSAGHGSMLLYSLLHLSGYDLPMEEIRRFRQLRSTTPGHPEHGETPGVEVTTGPLGQGFSNAVGMALAERILAARFGPELFNHRTWVLASDGDLMEGVASEVASLAGHLGLGRLTVLYDDNGVTIDGPTSIAFSEDVSSRFRAYGWDVERIDGHDPAAVRSALAAAQQSEDRPHLIVCRTHIGRGSPLVDSAAAHGGISSENAALTRKNLGWELEPFEVPEKAREGFRSNAERGAELRAAWEQRKAKQLSTPGQAELWNAMVERRLPENLAALLPDFSGTGPTATRQASGKILNAIAADVPGLVGGSADLAASNSVMLQGEASIERGKFEGRNVHFGVREHGMAGVANGLALHGGIRPFVSTFLVFSDYMRPSIRLAAMMRQPVAYVFTHDSIFVGEDGPTHQPVEQLAGLRSVPNLPVWRPGDARETAASWRMALEREKGPLALVLTRQTVPVLNQAGVEDKALRGGYVLCAEEGAGAPELVIVATGSEIHIALEAGSALAEEGRRVRVVSVPCLEEFLAQSEAYRESVLPRGIPRLVVEAGVELGLAQLLRAGDRFHGMTGFGSSAPFADLAREFGFTAGNLIRIAREILA